MILFLLEMMANNYKYRCVKRTSRRNCRKSEKLENTQGIQENGDNFAAQPLSHARLRLWCRRGIGRPVGDPTGSTLQCS